MICIGSEQLDVGNDGRDSSLDIVKIKVLYRKRNDKLLLGALTL